MIRGQRPAIWAFFGHFGAVLCQVRLERVALLAGDRLASVPCFGRCRPFHSPGAADRVGQRPRVFQVGTCPAERMPLVDRMPVRVDLVDAVGAFQRAVVGGPARRGEELHGFPRNMARRKSSDANAEPNHWSERGRAAPVANAEAMDHPRRSVLSFGQAGRGLGFGGSLGSPR